MEKVEKGNRSEITLEESGLLKQENGSEKLNKWLRKKGERGGL